jgi:hypothetical protein
MAIPLKNISDFYFSVALIQPPSIRPTSSMAREILS